MHHSLRKTCSLFYYVMGKGQCIMRFMVDWCSKILWNFNDDRYLSILVETRAFSTKNKIYWLVNFETLSHIVLFFCQDSHRLGHYLNCVNAEYRVLMASCESSSCEDDDERQGIGSCIWFGNSLHMKMNSTLWQK